MNVILNHFYELFDIVSFYIYDLFASNSGFRPYAMILFYAAVFIPAICFVLRRVFNG